MQKQKVLGFGNPLLDISATVPDTELEKWGVTLNNAILAEEKHQPLYAKLAEDYDVQYIAGGATLNSIRVAQWVLSASDEPNSTSFVGCIGTDDFGKTMKKQLEADGVNNLFLETDGKPTGTCAVLVKDKERSLIANLASAELYKVEHFKSEEVEKAVSEAGIFYMAGFPITHDGGKATIEAVCKHADENTDKVLCMNISAPFLVQVPPFLEGLKKAIRSCTYVFCNESEAEAMGKALDWKEDTTEARALKMSAMGHDRLTAVVTQGSGATIVAHKGKADLYEVKANPWTLDDEKIIDSNGAGDAFVGGFISQLALGMDVSQCVRIGHFAAGTIIQQSGCQCPPYVSVKDVLNK